MGKVRTRIIGLEDVEKEQKKEQKKKLYEKKLGKKKTAAPKVEEKPTKPPIKVEDQRQVEEKPEKKKVVRKAKARVRGKKYQKAKKLVTKEKTYSLKESLELLKKMKYAKFDESVELHINLTEKGLRGEVSLPHTVGKTTRAVVLNDKLLDDIENGKIEFDVLITEPSYMPKLAKFAKILGPRGLMPSPKTGTISPKPQEVLKKYTGGFIKWKTEAEAPLIHQIVGKISYDDKKLAGNIKSFIDSVGKPQIKAVFVKTTISPSIKVDLENL